MNKLLICLTVMFALPVMFALAGCTDTKFSRATNFGASADITCYSGGKAVYQGTSTGKIVNLSGDGISFVEKGSDDLMELRMDCSVRYH